MCGWFDDGYHLITPSNASFPYWNMGKVKIKDKNGKEIDYYLNPKPLDSFKKALGIFHGFMCPSKILINEFFSYGSGYFMMNRFDNRDYINVQKPKHEGIIIGWGGSLSHFQSFEDSGVLSAIKEVTSKRKDVKIMITGDKRVYDLVNIDPKQKLFYPFVPREEWPNVIANFDIGIAPLCGKYDECRSWIKIAEYMLQKTPWIASDNKAYEEYRSYGTIVRNTKKHWREALMNFVDTLDEKRNFAYNDPYNFVVKEDINLNVERILDVYRQIAKDKGIELKD